MYMGVCDLVAEWVGGLFGCMCEYVCVNLCVCV